MSGKPDQDQGNVIHLISAFLGMYIKVFKIHYQYIIEVCYVIFRSSEIKATVWMKI